MAQVVSAAISSPSQSSPLTAGCGLSSAAAATGWGKVSRPFTRVSHRSLTSLHSVAQLTERMASHTSSNVPRSCSYIHSFLALMLLMCQALYAALIRFWLPFTFSSIISRPCKEMKCICVYGGISVNPHCLNQWISSDFFYFLFFPEACTENIVIEGAKCCCHYCYCCMQPSVVGK